MKHVPETGAGKMESIYNFIASVSGASVMRIMCGGGLVHLPQIDSSVLPTTVYHLPDAIRDSSLTFSTKLLQSYLYI